MLLLGIETATPVCGVALTDDDRLIIEYRAAIKNAHGRLLAGAVQTLLRDAGYTAGDLKGIAVSIGPGSFTGLRIGLAMAKGLSLATGAPIAAIDTLRALAAQAHVQQGLIAPLLRSRANEYYAAVYQRENGLDRLVKSTAVIQWQQIAEWIPPEALLAGQVHQQPLPSGYQMAPPPFTLLSAYTIARLGCEQIRAGQVANADLLEPSYVQDFEAGEPKPGILKAPPNAR